MGIHNFWFFAMASLLLNITPGNDMLLVIGRSTAQGVKAGIVTSIGIMAGCIVHILAAVIGLSAIITQSAAAFAFIKYTGAAYLIYLGIRSLMASGSGLKINSTTRNLSFRELFYQGAITNVLNPKVALFFLAFLPQFVNMQQGAVPIQFLFLGIWFAVSGTLVNIMVAFLFGKIADWLIKTPRFIKWQERVTGTLLIALGVKVAFGSSK